MNDYILKADSNKYASVLPVIALGVQIHVSQQ